MKKTALIFLSAILIVAAACKQVGSDKPVITVSIPPQKYFVERIAGDHFSVSIISPPGSNHETYEPTPRQVMSTSKSKLFVMNGYLMFEEYLINRIQGSHECRILDLSQNVDLIVGDVVDHGDHVHLYGVDPHFWLSLVEVRKQLPALLEALCELAPDKCNQFRDNYTAFMAEIDSIDHVIREGFKAASTNKFLIYHPALAYFARDYGLEQIALEQDGKEPTASHIRKIIDIARK
ncbi:MAG TPA: zinc ABC transporter substrate-binding protein, partial [Bacteroidales bacterium]|nr:zinc ABC transporter substrate-binding protein [Bacteroidales bacterium]